MAAKQREKIRVETYIQVGDREVNTKDLNEPQREYVATMLSYKFLNAFYRGKAVFTLPDMPPAQDIFPELNT